jgi:osmotically-inducible protein OsmY
MMDATLQKEDGDQKIREAVEVELLLSLRMSDAARIDVSVRDGVASLSGHVSSYSQKVAAGEAALRAHGAAAIANDLTVCYGPGASTGANAAGSAKERSGEILARRVLAALRQSRYPLQGVRVEVRGNAVYLSGTVPWDHQRVAAHWEVERVPGVHVLRNGVRVRARCSALTITTAIIDAFVLNGCHRSHDAEVDVDGGRVSISGSVCSYAEWLCASRIAKAVPNVESVQNNLMIRR